MATSSGFHPEAVLEYAEATNYYLRKASVDIAEAFVSSIEAAVRNITVAPERWSVCEEPEIRRFVLARFPYVIYYRWEPAREQITIYAIMHCSREPGYWHHRKQ